MTAIDDFLGPLHEGVWEVAIPKEQVTEQLGPSWKESPINIPTPGTIASYRKGQYHIHETKTEWRVHLDRYDPEVHPALHLIDDAPLFLMISEMMITFFSEVRGKTDTTTKKLKEQDRIITHGFLIGSLAVILGLIFLLIPDIAYQSIFNYIIPMVVIGAGLIVLGTSFRWHPFGVAERKELIRGVFMTGLGVLLWFFPPNIWNLIILSILAIWMFASAIMLLNRARKGRNYIPEGFLSRIIIACISLALAILIFIYPSVVLNLFIRILGIIIILVGGTVILATLDLKSRPREYIPDKQDISGV